MRCRRFWCRADVDYDLIADLIESGALSERDSEDPDELGRALAAAARAFFRLKKSVTP